MNHLSVPSTSRQETFEDDELFDDTAFLNNFDNNSFNQAKVSESNLNNSNNDSALNISALCCDEEISGYDKLTGRTWIYPTNYPVRDYQFNIIKAALLKNTLVSLPTGLGKTFIAAVIMYNFYRWYPLGKIVFTAPTRPLVAQQIDACYNIIAIPPNDTIEMTGHMQVNTRKTHWQTKRVFFATPQVIYNDIKSGICPAESIRCLVMDEAHRARGNYAYCQIVATLDELGHRTYRMLALSATPGSKVDDVINVVRSLHIAHLELRTENCIDVARYSHSRKINTVIVQLGLELSQLRQQYVEILDGYARRLKQFNILPQNLGNLSKGRIVMLYKEYQTKDRGARHPQHNYIMKDFTLLIALYHGLELLVKHGSRVFLNFFDEHPEKSWIQSDDRLTALLERLRDDLGVNPLSLDRSILPDGTVPEMPQDLCFGHPKFDKLKSIVLDHFTSMKQKKQDTRAIIFCEYRESVNLVHCLLLQCRPLIIPQMFVGQGASGKDGKTVISQKQQLRVMRAFRSGACNALVATCVAEEGLDVGSVDLIICFDISTRSPVRLVQRCGRTGRERGGQVYILVTEGREHQTLMDCMRQRDGLNKKVLQSKEVENVLYKSNPRMMPRGFTPTCQKMFITVAKKVENKDNTEKTSKKGQKDLRSMLLNRTSTSGTTSSNKQTENSLINEDDFTNMFPEGYCERTPFRKSINYWAMNKETFKQKALETNEGKDLNLSKWLEWQRTTQKTVNVAHSKDTEFLSEILQKCDAKRLESTQNPSQISVPKTQEVISQRNVVIPNNRSPSKSVQTKRKQKTTVAKSPGKNYGDIRALFSTATKSTKSYTKQINDLGIQNDGSVPTKLINLLVDLNLNVDATNTKKCYVCENICDCKKIKKSKKNVKPPLLMKFLEDPVLPDIDLLDEITSEDVIKYRKSNKKITETSQNINISDKENPNGSKNFDLEFDLDDLETDIIESPKAVAVENIAANISTDNNFDIGDLDDIFADSSPEEAKELGVLEKTADVIDNKPTVTQEALGFFGLDSIEDIFADYEDDDASNNVKVENEHKKEQSNNLKIVSSDKPKDTRKELGDEPLKFENVPKSAFPVSPSILSGRQAVKELSTSPILCSQPRKFKLSTKKKPQSSTPNSSVKKRLILPDHEDPILIEDDNNKKNVPNSVASTTDKSMFTVTQIVAMINSTDNKSMDDTNIATKIKNSDTNEQDERSTSPIILTQLDRKMSMNTNISMNKTKHINNNKSESLIILDSDSDSEDTEEYDVKPIIIKTNKNVVNKQDTSLVGGKRKFDPEESLLTASPYFNKKQKVEKSNEKSLTLQEKVLAAITSNQAKDSKKSPNKPQTKTNNNNLTNFHCTISQSSFFSHKENQNPLVEMNKPSNDWNNETLEKQSAINVLQKYRKESKILTLRSKFDSIFKKSPTKSKESLKNDNSFEENESLAVNDRLSSPQYDKLEINNKENTPVKRNIMFDESDDDFTVDDKNRQTHSPKNRNKYNGIKSTTNHKVRKKKRRRNFFIEMEASISDEGSSGDELTDDSAGSIAEFICDDADVTRQEDMRAIYLKSIRSPVRNGFKIPELPHRFKKEDVFSQFVEEDSYEMDSFCVDSHIGLTQANDISELELAEIALEEERLSKKIRRPKPSLQDNDESPLIKRKNKIIKRQIHSDSDDSS